VSLGHSAGQALADPLLLGNVVLSGHRRACLCPAQPTPNVGKRQTFPTPKECGHQARFSNAPLADEPSRS
jgi:hypothetical protein